MSILIAGGFVLAMLLIILAVAFGVRGTRSDGEQGKSENMIKTVYIYLVLLATLMMTIGGSVAAFMAVADIVSPPSYYMSFAEYQRAPEKVTGQQQPAVSQEELKKNYEELVSQEKQRARDRAVNSLIKSFGWIVIPFPVFVYYQRKLRSNQG